MLKVQENVQNCERAWTTEPTLIEVLLLSVICYAVYIIVICSLQNYWQMFRTFGDNQPYVAIATGIRNWNFPAIKEWQFFGLPYAMVAFSYLTRTSFWAAVLVLSVVCSFTAVMLCNRLWGGWVAGLFAVSSREWMERSLLGGAEPLFLALLFGSFIAARRERWTIAAFLAALSTTVRPMGIFALLAIGLVLLWRKRYTSLLAATLVGSVVGALYTVPMRLYMGTALANVTAYGQADGSGGHPLTVPFRALFQNSMPALSTGLNVARAGVWIVAVLLALAAMIYNPRFRDYARTNVVEVIFCTLYVGLLFTYNSPWARIAFPRYVIPVIPFMILAFLRWLPRDRRLLWGFGLFSAVISGIETYGFTAALERLHKLLA